LAAALARRITHQNDRDRAELAKRDAAWARERERKAASTPAANNWTEIDRRCKAAAREAALAVAQEAANAMKQERIAAKRDLADEVRRLRIELAACSETIDELRRAVASSNRSSNSGEVVDLVPVSRRN